MESRMMELMEAIQESEGQAERRVLTLLGGRYISEKALVIDGKIVWESRKNGYFHGYTDEIKNITESGITYIGNEKVFCDTLGQEKQIVICGAGHVSIPVIKMAVMMDCEVIVLEDRPMYADHARMAGASQVICEPFEEALDKIQGSADTYFVILTRGHRYDQICLEKIAAKRACLYRYDRKPQKNSTGKTKSGGKRRGSGGAGCSVYTDRSGYRSADTGRDRSGNYCRDY